MLYASPPNESLSPAASRRSCVLVKLSHLATWSLQLISGALASVPTLPRQHPGCKRFPHTSDSHVGPECPWHVTGACYVLVPEKHYLRPSPTILTYALSLQAEADT